ncbi:unnamed protein product [Peronospora belbahrii]|uniref:C2 domain-containing protein n=1 Tax=Peronospora belbahrii TaxID=622444 RepID=A0AAU9L0I2_9STRA|nr:unnamed protein product [Peronospora belbahrii]
MESERPVSSSSYFERPIPSCRLLLRVYSAEGLRHVSSYGTYCKLYIGSTEMIRGSGGFSLRTQKLKSSTSSHSLGGLLHSSFGSTTRSNMANVPTMPIPSTSLSEGDLSENRSKMRVLKTNVQKAKRSDPVWNEKFDIPVYDMNEDMLSIRVKSARLMSSPAIGACAVSLKHLTGMGTATIDRWVDLRQGKKNAGRIRLQLRLVESSIARLQDSELTTRARNQQNRDTHLSLPEEETPEEVARRMKKTSRRDHKYHRSAQHFDGRPVTSTALGSSSGSSRSGSDKEEDQKRAAKNRDNSASATSNESIDDSELASDVSSPGVSPRPDRASKEGSLALENTIPTVREKTAGRTKVSASVAASAVGLDASYAQRGMMTRSELECSQMNMVEISRESRISRSSRRLKQQVSQEDEDDDDDFDAEHDNRDRSTTHRIGTHTKLSVLSSILDPRESSRMGFDDDDDDDEWGFLDKRDKSVNNESASFVLSTAASSTHEPRDSSRFSFSDSESDDEDDSDDEVKLEKAREQQRQQWQMEQRKMQLAGIKEVSQSMSDNESDDDLEDEDEFDDELVLNSPRMHFTPTITTLLGRESTNVLIDDEEDDEDEEEDFGYYKMSEDFIPMLEAFSPISVDSIDCALRRSSFD